MLEVAYHKDFLKKISKIKDNSIKDKIKQIKKIIENPKIGKPMRHARKGTRELYISPYHLAYAFFLDGNKLIFLDVYHKDHQ